MATKAQVRSRAKKLLNLFGVDGSRWVQGQLHYKGKEDGEVVEKWCLLGGMEKLEMPCQWFEEILHTEKPRYDEIPDFNDSVTWRSVRNLLSKIIHKPIATEAK